MNVFSIILVFVTSIGLSAHFLRDNDFGMMLIAVSIPFLLLIRKRWILNIVSGLLLLGSLEWIITAINIYEIRTLTGENYIRMLVIMSSVSLLTLISALLVLRKKFLEKYIDSKHDFAITSAFFFTAFLIGMPFLKVSFPILLLERFLPGFGWFEVFLLALYASFITEKILNPALTSIWRRRIWLIFSIVFFAQFIFGLIGYEIFLMTGKIHIPVPAIIMAGPLYRWSLSFMVFLFLGSIVLLGPAWCSYLCYFGVWDDVASRNKLRPKQLPKNRQWIRISIFVAIIIIAVGFNLAGFSVLTAGITAIIFGMVGVILMVIWSRKKGVMTHCTVYCPIGLLTVTLGKISPFRIKINSSCDECAKCHLACRYDALNMSDIKKRKPGLNCTLCGDCIGTCPHYSIEYKFLGLSPDNARTLFIVIAVAVHAAFLGIGRI